MAEVAVGAIAAEEAISTTIQGSAIAGYALAQPTLPLKATFNCMGSAEVDTSEDSLARTEHSLTAFKDHAYIFGGRTAKKTLAGNEMHIISLHPAPHSAIYHAVPALSASTQDLKANVGPADGAQQATLTNPDPAALAQTPCPRYGHSTVLLNGRIVMFGGTDDVANATPLKEAGRVWTFDPESSTWSCLAPVTTEYPVRTHHGAATWNGKLVVHGGTSPKGLESDTWLFDLEARRWSQLPDFSKEQKDSITFHPSPNVAIAHGKLYLITNGSKLSGQVHVLNLAESASLDEGAASAWTSFDFPTNPLTPGPGGRRGAGLLPIDTGMGRTYLLLVLGEKDDADASDGAANQWSGLWALQVPSPQNTAAKLKDEAREGMGVTSHAAEWSEVQVTAVEEKHASSGRVHPGPRAYFGSDALDGTKVLLWGGVNAAGAIEGDGWLLEIKGPSPTALFKRED